MRRIRVLVVEDSLVFRELLVQNLNKDPAIEVVASARDPYEARDAILEYRPDVMTLDIEMPRMNGIEFLKKLMPQYPLPVVMISALSDKVFDALNAGAVEFVEKPSAADRAQLEGFIRTELPVKIKIASIARIGNVKRPATLSLGTAVPTAAGRERILPTGASAAVGREKIIAIGASTGGTEAIASVLREFGTDIPGVVIVQHMPAGFTQMYANRLNNECQVSVREAKSGDAVLPGQVLIAPGGDSHMQLVSVRGSYQVALKKAPKVNGHCPSVDVLFDSVAEVAGKRALGIILTGMGGDGAKGLLKMRQAGAKTIGQDESTCVVYGMPKVAYELGAVEHQEKLADIPRRTYSLLNKL